LIVWTLVTYAFTVLLYKLYSRLCYGIALVELVMYSFCDHKVMSCKRDVITNDKLCSFALYALHCCIALYVVHRMG